MTEKNKRQWSKELCSACWNGSSKKIWVIFPFLGKGKDLGKKKEVVIEYNTNLTQFWEQFQNEVLESPSYQFNKTISKYRTVIIPSTHTALFPIRTCTFTKTSAHFTIREFETGRKRTSEWLETMPGKNLSSESWSSTMSSKLQCNMSQV